ncbi:hypothetical protein AB1285_18645 [Microbacterium sp. NRRL B-14842]|uniref:hypothetical protein n=1 Tax=Microbacterium TaxID=33882 RepID=UPI001656CFD8|nr:MULTISPECIES: hypothetical protein [Microbacterium]MCZ0711127.1 hypothetical protein [Microbacterium paraoxydans]MDH5133267.1 hypothetical protein [Microbacterium sp. RD10]MDH5136698.1 hypothetical protein [Microbacterium sp. RD11]MDH5146519.1 hypothetical protein [Microbacterium sp. RD12]MDH5153851.1 hypothetical protein [Microbacterium sp. RD06]
MRNLAVVVGGILLLGGAALLVMADQERAADVAAVKAEIARIEDVLDESQTENLALAERLTELRSRIAEQDADLSDTTGFLP